MSEHTPGPWHIESEPFNVWDQHGCLVASCKRSWKELDVAAADARLIAAAPKLLAACEAVRSAYASHQLYDKCPLPLIEAAIASAKGEPPPRKQHFASGTAFISKTQAQAIIDKRKKEAGS